MTDQSFTQNRALRHARTHTHTHTHTRTCTLTRTLTHTHALTHTHTHTYTHAHTRTQTHTYTDYERLEGNMFETHMMMLGNILKVGILEAVNGKCHTLNDHIGTTRTLQRSDDVVLGRIPTPSTARQHAFFEFSELI
jgi:hypothetical protein